MQKQDSGMASIGTVLILKLFSVDIFDRDTICLQAIISRVNGNEYCSPNNDSIACITINKKRA